MFRKAFSLDFFLFSGGLGIIALITASPTRSGVALIGGIILGGLPRGFLLSIIIFNNPYNFVQGNEQITLALFQFEPKLLYKIVLYDA